MDEIVLRSMLKWPNVPAVYGWLRLDRRGNWLIKTVAGRFERIVNSAVAEFIGRNYSADGEGRRYFQNGPQKVFVVLDYTPWVYRLDDTGEGLLAQTGARPRDLKAAFLDESGMMLLQTELGIGVLLDRDLQSVLARLTGERGEGAEQLVEELMRGTEVRARLFGESIGISLLRSLDVPVRFGFNPRPAPRPGEPEC